MIKFVMLTFLLFIYFELLQLAIWLCNQASDAAILGGVLTLGLGTGLAVRLVAKLFERKNVKEISSN